MEKFLQRIKQDKKFVITFLAVILVGIFLRTYNFHDWLRFSGDQSRDAKIISAAIENKAPLPLLGPKAGTTKFLLGPAYYYFSYASAKLFGNYPDKMAYPSLLSAILALPMLFIFLKEYFNRWMSLALTALASVSYVLVMASRFSSNPNLTPFFILLFLYAFLKILNSPEENNFLWSAVVGVAMGIGVQLHTTIFIIFPLTALLVLGYLWKKKTPNIGKYFFIILVISLLLNTTQFISEFNSHWQNSQEFFKGFTNDSSSAAGRPSKLADIVYISACQIHANSLMVSSFSPFKLDNSRSTMCQDVFVSPFDNKVDTNAYTIYMPLSILFSVAGYLLLIYEMKKEPEAKRRNFLGLVLLFNAVAFVIFIPIAGMMHSGYFLVLFITPFVILGALLELLMRKYGSMGMKVAMGVLVFLFLFSLSSDYVEAMRLQAGLENNDSNSTLGEIERMSNYILAASPRNSTVYISGEGGLALRFYKPLSYFLEERGDTSIMLEPSLKTIDPLGSPQGGNVQSGFPIYYVRANQSSDKTEGQAIAGHLVVGSHKFLQQAIFKLNN